MSRTGHHCVAALVAATLVLASGPAVAAPPGDDPVTPSDSAAPVTEVDEPAPEDPAPSGEAAPEDGTARQPDEAAPEPAPEEREPEPEPVVTLQGTRVKFLGGSPGELELFRIDPEATTDAVGTIGGIPYTRVCTDPCPERVQLEATDELFVAGPRIMPSRTFTLDEDPYELELQVRPGPKAIRFAGFGLTVGGAILVPGGGLLVGAFDNRNLDIAGFTLIGVGVAALAAGIGLLVRGRTLVQSRVRRR